MLAELPDWRRIELVTPADKAQNINFYTQRCGMAVQGYEMDGGVRVTKLAIQR